MASTTGIPERPPVEGDVVTNEDREYEPLLGRPGDAAQDKDKSIFKNIYLGTAVLTQFGVVILFLLVWVSVLTKPINLFAGHPLAQSLGILVLIQSILSLQPTHTVEQKRIGQRVHASLNLLAFLFLVTGVVIIEYNKFSSNGVHFHSVHGYLGVITSIVLLLQYFVGFTVWATPKLYGGDEKAKSLYKYHRWSGYLILVLLIATVIAATETDFNKNVLKIQPWQTILLGVIILAGVFPRIQLQKLGLKRPENGATGQN